MPRGDRAKGLSRRDVVCTSLLQVVVAGTWPGLSSQGARALLSAPGTATLGCGTLPGASPHGFSGSHTALLSLPGIWYNILRGVGKLAVIINVSDIGSSADRSPG